MKTRKAELTFASVKGPPAIWLVTPGLEHDKILKMCVVQMKEFGRVLTSINDPQGRLDPPTKVALGEILGLPPDEWRRISKRFSLSLQKSLR